ncbi:MAG TPA: hypothetical protein VFR30_10170 [Lysobacter sp.]|nr:hypothetical protein [Lysobacter sp.]
MKPTARMTRRSVGALLGALTAGAACGVARAQTPPRRYATMSLIGDALTAVQRQEVTGTRMDQNIRTEIKVNGDILDRAALGVLNGLIAENDPTAKPTALLIDEPVLYAKQEDLFDGKFVRLPKAIAEAAKAGGATHMLLLTKRRTALSFKFLSGSAGQGSASGLGLYIDPHKRMQLVSTKEETEGFLGLYVHLRATVVDLASEAIVADTPVTLTEMYINVVSTGGGALPWDALPAAEKIRILSDLLTQSLRDKVPPLLTAS